MRVASNRQTLSSAVFNVLQSYSSFGANGYGIYQHCPPENLHSIKEGLFTYLLTGLVDQLSSKRKALAELDSLFQEISKHCKHQSDCNFPCMSVPFGFSNISKVTGDEKEGLLIVMILLMEAVSGKGALKKANMSGVLFHWWVHLFQEVLWYNCWMSKEEYDCKTLKTAEDNVCLLLAISKVMLYRTEGYGMKIQKFHQQIHGPANIDYFGSPK